MLKKQPQGNNPFYLFKLFCFSSPPPDVASLSPHSINPPAPNTTFSAHPRPSPPTAPPPLPISPAISSVYFLLQAMQKEAKELSIQGLSITNHDPPSPATEPAGVLQLESFSFSPPINSADNLQNFVPTSADHTNNLEHSTHDFLAHSNCYYNHNPEASSCYDHHHQQQQQQQQQQRWRRSENHDEEQERLMAQERRVRRLISNRESARRSRLRRRKQLEELEAQVLCLVEDNHQLTDALNRVLESNYQLLQENAHLKHEASSFRIIVADLIALAAEDFPADDDRSGQS